MKKIIIGLVTFILLFGGYIFYRYNKISSVSDGKKITEYDKPGRAVLVIDIQRGITDKSSTYGLDVNQRREMMKNCNKIANNSNRLGLTVIYIKQIFEDDFLLKLFTKGMMQKGSESAQFTPELKIINKNIFIKHIMDAFSNPELGKFLVDHKINHLYITGLDAEACVDKTVKAALKRDYTVTIVKDAVASTSDEKKNNKIKEFAKRGAKIISTDELLKL